jgi:hypothetical protein
MMGRGFAIEVLTNDSVISMSKAGLSPEVILEKIRMSQAQFDLSTDGLVALKAAGVNDLVIKAMLGAKNSPPQPTPPPTVSTAQPTLQPKTPGVGRQDTKDAIALYEQGKLQEASAAFDKLMSDRPSDDDLKIWKSLTLLEQAREMKDAGQSAYKPLVTVAYGLLRQSHVQDAYWNFAMAKAYWLNDRPQWSQKAAGIAIGMRGSYPEAQILLGDLAFDEDVEVLNNPKLTEN